MTKEILLELTWIVLLGVGAQWLAWRVHLPSILLLLLAGFIAGPVTGILNPEAILGEDLLMPLVSISVGLILFEGGLTLKFRELKAVGNVVRSLVTTGALVTWCLSTLAARFLLGWELALATLFGAILVVTGPTVVLPLLRHLQPSRQVASILKWEGIVIDPIGALLALLVFEATYQGLEAFRAIHEGLEAAHGGMDWRDFAAHAGLGFVKTMFIGSAIGGVSAGFMHIFFKRYWVPDFLQSPFSLMVVVCAFTTSNILQDESGLLTVTLMGIYLANQRAVDMRHILQFKENLRVLLIAALFIVLSARLELADFKALNLFGSLAFLAVLMLIVRPAAVWVSTARSSLKWEERLFLAWMAPRGIVAAAVASIFALKLANAGMAQAEQLVPLTFLVIVGTVLIYGLTSGPLARRLKVSNPNPQGVLIVGAHPLARQIGQALQGEGFSVLVVDNNRELINQARLDGLPVYYGSILSEHASDELELAGIGRLLALTPNDQVNSLAALHFIEQFGRSGVFQLPPHESQKTRAQSVSEGLQGRLLFAGKASLAYLTERLRSGAVIKKNTLTREFTFDSFKAQYGDEALPLFAISPAKQLRIFATDQDVFAAPGHILVSLVNPLPRQPENIPVSQEGTA